MCVHACCDVGDLGEGIIAVLFVGINIYGICAQNFKFLFSFDDSSMIDSEIYLLLSLLRNMVLHALEIFGFD